MATLAQQIATAAVALGNCEISGNVEWRDIWTARLDAIARNVLPSGSGFNNGTSIDVDNCNGAKLAFETSFHHMTEHGVYDGWTEHSVLVLPSFVCGFNVKVSGRNRNDIKDYIGDMFAEVLSREYDWPAL